MAVTNNLPDDKPGQAESTAVLGPCRDGGDSGAILVDRTHAGEKEEPVASDSSIDEHDLDIEPEIPEDHHQEKKAGGSRPQSQLASLSASPKVVPRAERRGLLARLALIPEVEKPYEYKNSTKWMITAIVALAAAAAPMGSGIFLREHILSPEPSSFSETLGRRTIYIVSFALFLVFSILSAVSVNISMLVVMRVLGGGASASVQAVGAGTIADIWEPAERGGAMGIFYLGPLVGPLCAPIIGGALSQAFNWRATMWFLTIYGGVMLLMILFCLPETLTILYSASIAFFALYVLNISINPPSPRPLSFAPIPIGLCYLAPSLGYILASTVGGRWIDYIMAREAKKAGRWDDSVKGVSAPATRVLGGHPPVFVLPSLRHHIKRIMISLIRTLAACRLLAGVAAAAHGRYAAVETGAILLPRQYNASPAQPLGKRQDGEMSDENSDVVTGSGRLAMGQAQDYFGPAPAMGPYSEEESQSAVTTPGDRGGVPLQPHGPGDIAVPVELDSRLREERRVPEPLVPARREREDDGQERYELYGSDVGQISPSLVSPYTAMPSPPEETRRF
ncbi:hypothetical protein N0V88_000918 [Collariella sp. IMI 366227]|nr:hypothetical protein N0V88_000918 [Collariella sp. IMI 366227]